jgi:hypothetical protein
LRLKIATLAIWAAMAGGAQASSFTHVAPPPAGKSPSIVRIGPPTLASAKPRADAAVARTTAKGDMLVPLAYPLPEGGPAKAVVVSPSVLAFESTVPPVTFEKVAAISVSHPAPQPKPLVIRGGLVGDAFSQRTEPVVLPQTAAADGKPNSSRNRKREYRRQQEAPRQAAPEAPPPATSRRQFAVPG